MPLPLAPVAGLALRYGLVALTAYAVSRRLARSETSQLCEDALDQVDEGLSAHRPKDRPQVNAQARWRRVVRLGTDGPGFEFDATALGRLKFRKI